MLEDENRAAFKKGPQNGAQSGLQSSAQSSAQSGAERSGVTSQALPPRSNAGTDPARRRRRESFLADLAEAQQLRERVTPRRTRMARLRQQQLMRTFLY